MTIPIPDTVNFSSVPVDGGSQFLNVEQNNKKNSLVPSAIIYEYDITAHKTSRFSIMLTLNATPL